MNKGFLNTNSVTTQELMQTARTLEVDWRQVLWGSMSTGTKEDESSTGRIWAAGFHHVTARSYLAHILKLMTCLFI
jgi:hypothetical protein